MKATVIRAAEAPQFEVHGAHVTAYASPSRGSPALCAWRLCLDAGSTSPFHSLEVDEVFIVLRGEAVFELSGERMALRAGDGITVPKATPFRIDCAGAKETFEAVACVTSGVKARVENGEPFVPPWAV